MTRIEIVIPARNEEGNLKELIERIDRAMTMKAINYGVIIVENDSTDNTFEVAKKLTDQYPVKVISIKGNKGKAFAILDGIAISDAEYIAFIDADLQYPPELLPEMLNLAIEKNSVVVANRKVHKTGFFRSLVSHGNRLLFGKLFLKFNCDVQSGLKVFRRELAQFIEREKITRWTFDMHLLKVAKDFGYGIDSLDCEFAERKNGNSKVSVLKDSWEIGSEALKLKFSKTNPYILQPESSKNMVGAGVVYEKKKYITHTTLPLDKTALITITGVQKIFIVLVLLTIAAGLIMSLKTTLILLIGTLSAIYFIDVVFGLFTTVKSLKKNPELTFTDEELEAIDDTTLPIYTILCPLFKESRVLPAFIDALAELNWPKDKLDVILLLEEIDKETQDAASSMNLPEYVRVVVVPDSQPKTKPKACNYGLNFAKGEYLVIYDAEDRADKYQLKKAYLGFQRVSENTVCLQSKLNYYNPNQNLLTRLFTSEYSLWFDIILPGFQSINAVIPLGGTSNHFKTKALYELGGWDPFNVTEDCDLGVRLFKAGKKTALLDSTTYEEANSNLKNWIRQRSRWIKGYYQTYLVHMRHPFQFFREFGLQALFFQLVIGMRTSFMLINPLLWLTTIAYFSLYYYIGEQIESLFPPTVFYIATTALVAGNFIYIYNYMIACAKRENWSLVKYVYLIPVYWLFSSVASFVALKQLITNPFYWEKTNHGLHLKKQLAKSESLIAEKENAITEIEVPYAVVQRPSFLLNSIWVVRKNVKEFAGIFTFRRRVKQSRNGLHILIFNWRDIKHTWSGGAEWYFQEMAKRWVSEGNSVTIFCGRDSKTKSNEVIDGVEIIRRGGFYTVYVWAFLYYIAKLRGKYDIVIDSENGIPFFTPLFVRVPKILVIHHIHKDYLKESAVFSLRHIRSFVLAHVAYLLESVLMPIAYKRVHTVTVSESSRQDIIRLGMGTAETISIVSPGVNVSEYENIAKTKYPSFVYLGRLKAYKNIDIAIQSFKLYRKNNPSAKFTIAGDGSARPELESLVRKLHLTQAVQFTGRVEEEEKVKLLSQSWAAIQHSSYEGWGMTVIETNAGSTPVIASDVNGLRDSVVNNKTGLLVPLKNVKALALAMETITQNTPLRLELSKGAYEWARNFSWDTISEQFMDIMKRELDIKEEHYPAQNINPELAVAEEAAL